MASQALLFQSLEKLSKKVVGEGRIGNGYMQPSAPVIPQRPCHAASTVGASWHFTEIRSNSKVLLGGDASGCLGLLSAVIT